MCHHCLMLYYCVITGAVSHYDSIKLASWLQESAEGGGGCRWLHAQAHYYCSRLGFITECSPGESTEQK